MAVALRAVAADDYDALFEQMRDPEAVWMAAFTVEDPNDRHAFNAAMARNLGNPDVTMRAITHSGRLVGSIASYVEEGTTEITYWVDPAHWGEGIASGALVLFLDEVDVRPLRARAASDNRGSLRVLEKLGFKAVGTAVSHAPARGTAIEETILELSE